METEVESHILSRESGDSIFESIDLANFCNHGHVGKYRKDKSIPSSGSSSCTQYRMFCLLDERAEEMIASKLKRNEASLLISDPTDSEVVRYFQPFSIRPYDSSRCCSFIVHRDVDTFRSLNSFPRIGSMTFTRFALHKGHVTSPFICEWPAAKDRLSQCEKLRPSAEPSRAELELF